LREFLQNSLQIAGGIGLLRVLPCQLQSTFDSGMFSLRFRIVRSTTANGQARNWRGEFFHARRFEGRCGAAVICLLAASSRFFNDTIAFQVRATSFAFERMRVRREPNPYAILTSAADTPSLLDTRIRIQPEMSR